LNFLDRFPNNTQIPNFTKICPAGAELLHAEGRTDIQTYMIKLIAAFREFADAPEIRTFSQFCYVYLCTWQQHHENSLVLYDSI